MEIVCNLYWFNKCLDCIFRNMIDISQVHLESLSPANFLPFQVLEFQYNEIPWEIVHYLSFCRILHEHLLVCKFYHVLCVVEILDMDSYCNEFFWFIIWICFKVFGLFPFCPPLFFNLSPVNCHGVSSSS